MCTATNNDIDSPVIIKDGTIKVLTNLALEFDDLANTCLLVLHLEVRVQCFHYLRSSEKGGKYSKNANDNLEPDSKVLKLTKVLSDMDEALNATLHPRKTKVSLLQQFYPQQMKTKYINAFYFCSTFSKA